MYRGDLDATITHFPKTTRHVVSLSEEANEVSALARNFETLFAKELCDLLVSLETASPGYSMEIACVLTRKPQGQNQEGVEFSPK